MNTEPLGNGIRERFVTALIALGLTFFGTVAYQSFRFAFLDAPEQISQLYDERILSLKQQKILLTSRNDFSKIYVATKINERIDSLRDFTSQRSLSSKQKSEFHEKAVDALADIQKEYGRLAGFSPENVAIQQSLYSSLLGLGTAEETVWREVLDCTRAGASIRIPQCQENVLTKLDSLAGANQKAMSAEKDNTVHEQLREAKEEFEKSKYESSLSRLKKLRALAYIGCLVSVVCWGGLSMFLFQPRQISAAVGGDPTKRL